MPVSETNKTLHRPKALLLMQCRIYYVKLTVPCASVMTNTQGTVMKIKDLNLYFVLGTSNNMSCSHTEIKYR
jgi:hypothetical protein